MSTTDKISALFQQGVVVLSFRPSDQMRGGVMVAAQQLVPTASGSLEIVHGAHAMSASDCLNKVAETVAHCAEKKAHIARPPDGSIISMPGGN